MKPKDLKHAPWELTKVKVYNVVKQEFVELDAKQTTYMIEEENRAFPVRLLISEESGTPWVETLHPDMQGEKFYIETESGIEGVFVFMGQVQWAYRSLVTEQLLNWNNLEELISQFEQETDVETFVHPKPPKDMYPKTLRSPTDLGEVFHKRRGTEIHPTVNLIEFEFSEDQVKLILENMSTGYVGEVWIDLNTREVTKTVELTPAETVE